MATLRLSEIINMSSGDRAKKLLELRAELARMKTMVRAGGAVENPTRIRELRRIIAQILTIENEVRLNLRAPAKKEKTAGKKPKVNESKEKQD